MRTLPQNPPLQISRFESCASTNQSLLHAAEAGAPAGSVYVTREQTAGKGRRGRVWFAEPGSTLAFSILWTYPVNPQALSGLSLAVGVALMQALASDTLGKQRAERQVGLKWPNDIYVRRHDQGKAPEDAKAGGILIESIIRQKPGAGGEREMAVVIGVGLNCLISESIRNAVSDQPVAALAELFENPETMTPDRLLPIVLESLAATLSEFERSGFGGLRAQWDRYHLWQGQAVAITEGAKELLVGNVLGVDHDGALRIETAKGIERIVSGDVSLRRKA